MKLLPLWGAQGGTTADPSGEIGASNFLPLPIFDGRLGAKSAPALPMWGAQGGKTVDNPGENGIILGKDTEGAEDATKYFDDVQLKTEPGKVYFWSDLGETGAETAASIAKKYGGVTLETTIEWTGCIRKQVPNMKIT